MDAEATTTLPISEHAARVPTGDEETGSRGTCSRSHTLSTTMEDPARRSLACGLCSAAVCSALGENARSTGS